ncbi:MAG TPA: alpha/beta fold hydrolase [Myxococcales bacterium]|nr:alpha/beta fold hydrolase [Myxococcales bacterium]
MRAVWLPMLAALACGARQQFFDLGDFALENGEVVRGCRIGYRTYGSLDAAGSNAVLVAPWLMGTSREVAAQIGPGKLVDSSRYFVVAVDALGNGVSTSPSNSRAQPGARFPAFSMRDMVESEHRLVTRGLGLRHLRAVVGISAGGMQVFQWATAHPGFFDKAVAVAASPRSTAAERASWARLGAGGREPGWKRAARAAGQGSPIEAARQLRIDADDLARQAQAIAGQDVTAPFGGSMERAAAAVRARMLVAVSRRDEVVDPAPALEFAGLLRGQVLELDGRCGHHATVCEKATLWAAVAKFLDE